MDMSHPKPRRLHAIRPCRPYRNEHYPTAEEPKAALPAINYDNDGELVDLAKDLITHTMGSEFAKAFEDFYIDGDYVEAKLMLETCLETQDDQGYPVGPRGTHSERFAARELLKKMSASVKQAR